LGKDDMGIGGMVYNDMSNIYQRSGGYLSYSYQIPFDSLHKVRIGISLGAVQNRINFDKIQVQDPNETTLLEQAQGATKFDGSFGALYTYGDKLEVGVSSLQIFNSTFTYANQANEKELSYKLLRHYYLSGKYLFVLKPNEWNLSPMVLFRSVQGSPIQWDLGVQGEWRNFVWLTAMYRSQYGMSFSAGGKINQNIKLGYAYEVATNGMGKYSKGSHEIVMSYTFHKRKYKQEKNIESAIDEEQFDAMQSQIDSLEVRLTIAENKALAHKKDYDSVLVRKKEMFDLIEKNAQEIAKKQAEFEELQKAHLAKKDEFHEFVEKENVDLSKLDTFNIERWDYFVVIGTYTNFNYAKFLQKVFKRDYNLTTHLTKSATQKYYIVWTKQVFTKKAAEKEIARINKNIDDKYIDDGAWLYHVRRKF
jgi:type IX secretion system PorP/SprF family membrane protein